MIILFENLPDVVTLKQLAEFLKVSEMTIRRALISGELKGFKIARDWRIDKKAILQWIEEQKKNG